MSAPLTPDFDCWGTPVGRVSARSDAGGRLVQLAWTDGRESRLHAIRLHNHATDSGTLNTETRESRGDITTVPADPRVEVIRVDNVSHSRLFTIRHEPRLVHVNVSGNMCSEPPTD